MTDLDWREQWQAHRARRSGERPAVRPKPPPRKRVAVYVQPDEDLVWLYHAAACELGFSAAPLDGCGAHDPARPRSVSDRRIRAANRQRELRAALATLAPIHQATIEACYKHQFAPHVEQQAVQQMALTIEVGKDLRDAWAAYQRLAREHGIAAGAIERSLRARAHGSAPESQAQGYALGGEWTTVTQPHPTNPGERIEARVWRPEWHDTRPGPAEDAPLPAEKAPRKPRPPKTDAADRALAERAVVAVCEAHDAWRDAREMQARARRELRDAKKGRRAAMLRRALGLDALEERAAAGREVLAEMGIEVAW